VDQLAPGWHLGMHLHPPAKSPNLLLESIPSEHFNDVFLLTITPLSRNNIGALIIVPSGFNCLNYCELRDIHHLNSMGYASLYLQSSR